MMKRFLPRFFAVMLITLILMSAMNAVAAGNIVPVTRLDDVRLAITTSDFTPAACSSLGATNIVTGTGFIFGTNASDLIMGSNQGDWIFGFGGNDCIVGGGGDDLILGSGDTDVCIGGPGNDSFNQCETQTQ
jgi:hypothetical protein